MTGEIEIKGIPALNSTIAALPAVTERAAQRAIDDWTEQEASTVQSAASRVDRQARLAAHGVKASGGRLVAGGSGRLPNGNGTYGDVFFGAEFGGGARPTTRQFRPYKPRGYWFFPTVEADQETTLLDAAAEGLDAAADRWDN